jgi:hypothetical protein
MQNPGKHSEQESIDLVADSELALQPNKLRQSRRTKDQADRGRFVSHTQWLDFALQLS